jgi:hypothetical protein
VMRNLLRVTELCGGGLADVVSVRLQRCLCGVVSRPAAVAHLRGSYGTGRRRTRRDRLGVLARRRMGRLRRRLSFVHRSFFIHSRGSVTVRRDQSGPAPRLPSRHANRTPGGQGAAPPHHGTRRGRER